MTESSAGLRNKDGSISKMRAHRGNIPTLPQTKACPHCSARFTRSTHLTRHMKNHSNERQFKCQTCPAQFTRSDLLARHRKNCEDPSRPNRLRSCILCTESKVKCDRNDPCSRCSTRGKDCLFSINPRKTTPPDELIGTISGSTSSDSPAVASTSHISPPNDNPGTSLSLESLPEELAHLTVLATLDHSQPLPVHSHLSPLYDKDAFGSLFKEVFSSSESPTPLDDFHAFPPLKELPLQTGTQGPWFQQILMHPHNSLPQTQVDQQSLLKDFFNSRELKAADPKHYLYLFFNTFATQMPIIHTATFTLEDNPPYLLKAFKACGAIFVRTRKASTYIAEALAAAREGLAQAFTNTLMEPTEQVHLVITVVLLQTIGLWHQKYEERTMSSMYHAMLVTAIRRAGLISKIPHNVQTMWRQWAFHEMTKRALLLSYLHDCAQPIFFGLPSSYFPSEVSLQLPCEDELWKAGSAEEWFSILQTPSLYPSERRLTGHDMCTNLASMNGPQFIPTPNLSRFSHFVLIHAILRDLFAACSEPVPDPSRSEGAAPSQAMLSVQYGLHNWLQSWTTCTNHLPDTEEPSFFNDVLPFYWLGQVAILARQEGLSPFSSTEIETGEVRFKMIKRWLKHIRSFLDQGDESTLFWDELMKIRLQSWHLEDGIDDQDGLLGFFPDVG
ncbi:fungal-specific transcription factor domain-containing protein [Mycena olivaceomarginata]|nr:fungal-specific transcription factor domain-containing protein [Mycena olivaceomarginata]